jgi:hypothetical protein
VDAAGDGDGESPADLHRDRDLRPRGQRGDSHARPARGRAAGARPRGVAGAAAPAAAGLAALFLRQLGHAILEPPCHDKEGLLLGYNTRNKSLILGAYLAIPLFHLLRAPAWDVATLGPVMATVAEQWFLFTLTVVVGRVLYLLWAHNAWLALVWVVKLVTDPLTDIVAYSPRYLRRS